MQANYFFVFLLEKTTFQIQLSVSNKIYERLAEIRDNFSSFLINLKNLRQSASRRAEEIDVNTGKKRHPTHLTSVTYGADGLRGG